MSGLQFNNYSKVISSSASTAYAGSIDKIVPLVTGPIDRIEWGDSHLNPMNPKTGSAFSPISVSGPITATVGSVIPGPISRMKTGATGAFLIYIKN